MVLLPKDFTIVHIYSPKEDDSSRGPGNQDFVKQKVHLAHVFFFDNLLSLKFMNVISVHCETLTISIEYIDFSPFLVIKAIMREIQGRTFNFYLNRIHF